MKSQIEILDFHGGTPTIFCMDPYNYTVVKFFVYTYVYTFVKSIAVV